jgi:hypothetical protein
MSKHVHNITLQLNSSVITAQDYSINATPESRSGIPLSE